MRVGEGAKRLLERKDCDGLSNCVGNNGDGGYHQYFPTKKVRVFLVNNPYTNSQGAGEN